VFLTRPTIWPKEGEGEAVNTTLHFINEADESFIDGDQAVALFVLMYSRVPTAHINICAAGKGKWSSICYIHCGSEIKYNRNLN
jgi:hypothetical protein